MFIREFTEADLEQVFDLANTAFDEQYRPDVFLYFHSLWPQGQLVMTSPEGRLIGFINGTIGSDGTGRIMLLAVNRMMRGLGLGVRLLREFEVRAAAAGCQRLMLESRATKPRLLSFYRRNGFVAEGLIPSYYRDGEDGILMSKPIQLNI